MSIKYSRKEFEGYTHRFIVRFQIENDENGFEESISMNIYSNSSSYQELEDFIKVRKSDKVLLFSIEHRASREQDQMTSKFLDEFLS